MGGSGELVIGGVGLARYLDPEKDAEKYAPLRVARLGARLPQRRPGHAPSRRGWSSSGAADEQIKLGGRRIELGEVDAALQALPGVAGAAAAVRTARSGNQLLVGYVVTQEGWDHAAAVEQLRAELPAALVPLLAPVDELPTRTSGKVDRDALPWPLAGLETGGPAEQLYGTEAWLAEQWSEVLGIPVSGAGDDFFAIGGSSLAAAQLTTRLRTRYPSAAVLDIYQQPSAAQAGPASGEVRAGRRRRPRRSRRCRCGPRWSRLLLLRPAVHAARAALDGGAGRARQRTALVRPVPVGADRLAGGSSPRARRALQPAGAARDRRRRRPAAAARREARPVPARRQRASAAVDGRAARRVQRRDLADRVLAGALRAGARRQDRPRCGPALAAAGDRHAQARPRLPPSSPRWTCPGTGWTATGWRSAPVKVGAGAVVGTRSMLFPGARVGKRAEVAPGSAVVGQIPTGQRWAGAPAVKLGKAKRDWPKERPQTRDVLARDVRRDRLRPDRPAACSRALPPSSWRASSSRRTPGSARPCGAPRSRWCPATLAFGFAYALLAADLRTAAQPRPAARARIRRTAGSAGRPGRSRS